MSKIAHDTDQEQDLDLDVVRYELMAILSPDLATPAYKKQLESLKELLATHKGSIRHEEEWGKRELAYNIKKHTHGHYVVIDFDMPPAEAQELNNQLRITPEVIRYLIVKLPVNYTPQKYNLDEEVKRPEPKPDPIAPAYEKPVKREAPRVVKREEEPKQEVVKESKKDLSKLDEKLEAMLSSDQDLNL